MAIVKGNYFITSESVGNGHPDKVCDQISDAVLDAVLKDDPAGRVACETFISAGLVIVGGDITTKTYIDVHKLVRGVLRDIGYTSPVYGFDASTCAILNAINCQSPDIAQGVDAGRRRRPRHHVRLRERRDKGIDAASYYTRPQAGQAGGRGQKKENFRLLGSGLQEPGHG